jgi:NAD(P)H-dependent glutamate synthase small subunit
MGKPTGFMEFGRQAIRYRDPVERLGDWRELQLPARDWQISTQGARCMDCGVPFCQSETGCPIDNLIPEWNEMVHRERWREALERLERTNDFPEITGRVCPAPCEGACVLGLIEPPVAIKSVECAIADKGFEMGWVRPRPPRERTGRRVAVVGSGPAGLVAAARLNRLGHRVEVHERDDRFGGLLMYGIPAMKLDKRIVERRIELLREEGVEFVANSEVGVTTDAEDLVAENDAVLLAVGAGKPRELEIPGRDLVGVHQAMEYLCQTTRSLLDSGFEDGRHPGGVPTQHNISAKNRRVVVIGGGDTGTDCLATALRQGCRTLVNLEILPQPPRERALDNPWPEWPRVLTTDYGHAEAVARFGEDPRRFAFSAVEFVGDAGGRVAAVRAVPVGWERRDGGLEMRPVPGAEAVTFEADLVLLALGFLGPEDTLGEHLGLERDRRSNFRATAGDYATSVPGVFAAGDCRRGQSLVVWAMREGREAAAAIDRYLDAGGG